MRKNIQGTVFYHSSWEQGGSSQQRSPTLVGAERVLLILFPVLAIVPLSAHHGVGRRRGGGWSFHTRFFQNQKLWEIGVGSLELQIWNEIEERQCQVERFLFDFRWFQFGRGTRLL